MPIKPENRKHYTKAAGWPDVRAAIRKRAADYLGRPCCELCGAPNGAYIVRTKNAPGKWHPSPVHLTGIRVVITIAHLNQDPTDNRMVNLLALCQRCHNRIDAPWRQRNAAATRAAKAGG